MALNESSLNYPVDIQRRINRAWQGRFASAHDNKETTLTTNSKQVHDRAEAEFKKQARTQDARAAASEYGAELLALRTKTSACAPCGWAKEAADAAAEPQSAAEPKPAA